VGSVETGEVSVTNRFRTFYRLTKPLLMSILLILNFFHCSKEKIPQPKFCGDPDRWTPTGLAPGAVHVGGLCVCVCVVVSGGRGA